VEEKVQGPAVGVLGLGTEHVDEDEVRREARLAEDLFGHSRRGSPPQNGPSLRSFLHRVKGEGKGEVKLHLWWVNSGPLLDHLCSG